MFLALERKFPHFIEPERPLPHSQQLTTYPCPEEDQTSQLNFMLFLKDPL
jgi:hypothetical protein